MLRRYTFAFAVSTASCLNYTTPPSPAAVSDASADTFTPDGTTPTPQPGTCTPDGGSPPPMAPNGYYTQGATVCTPAGTPHLFHGVDRPTLEFCPDSTDPSCTHLSADDFQLMGSWNANVVRVALDQDRWLSAAALYDPNYASTVDQVVAWAEAAGLDVILDLHWSDRGDLTVTSSAKQAAGNSEQQPMADVNSIEFWKEVAARYRGDGRVLFELYNEPNSVSWSIWLYGGMSGGYEYAGMQMLYDAIRNDAHADNVVIAGGLDWAFDLSQVKQYPIQGYNVMYAAHVYRAGDPGSQWQTNFGYLAQQNVAPVIITEFGDNQSTPNCTSAWDTSVIAYADQWSMSWSAWAWYATGSGTLESLCAFPSIISDWSATPSVQGQAVLAALQNYPRAEDAGTDAAPEAAADAGDDGGPAGDADAGALDATTGDEGGAGALDATTIEAEAGSAGAGDEGDAGIGDETGDAADADASADDSDGDDGPDGGE
ncbi:MAG TPA: cellulase family glycosylhydrolase [Polyangiaceae bacterium]